MDGSDVSSRTLSPLRHARALSAAAFSSPARVPVLLARGFRWMTHAPSCDRPSSHIPRSFRSQTRSNFLHVLHVIYVFMSLIRYVHPGLNVDAETVNELLDQLYKVNRENLGLRRAIEKGPWHKYTSPKSKPYASSKKGDRKVGYVCANDEFFGLTVYENSNGRYVNDNGKRIDASRFKSSKHKPKA